jgi:hypothetical protein
MDEINNYFSGIRKFILPGRLFDETITRLREEGGFSVESIVFWIGRVDGDGATITKIAVPRGPGVFKHRFQIRVRETLIAAICELLDPPRAVLLGQVHTHMQEAFHSPTDDRYSLDTLGYLSLVVPDFGRGDSSRWQEWAFHECEGSQTFRRLGREEVRERFVVDPAAPVSVHVITA